MAQVRVVTDSAADLPADLATALGICVVPLSVHFGEKTYLDGETMTPAEFYAMLAGDPHFPRTSQPSVGRFEEAYTRLRDEGAEIISIHLSSRLSGTFNAASLAARSVEGAAIHLVDSQLACRPQGDLALEAAKLAEQGRAAAEILERVENLRKRIHFGIMLDNLTHIQRGGRIGRAQGLLGALLSIKPILSVEEGVVVPRQRVRTTARALQELANEARGWAPLTGLRVMHTNAPKLAEELVRLVRPFAPGDVPVQIIGPVVGVHVGAGAVGLISTEAEKQP